MSVATLREVLHSARTDGYAVAGLVCLGWEDATAYVQAAEETGIPVILQAGPSCRQHTPVPVLGKMFRSLAEQASVPIVCHIDHGYSVEDCMKGIEHGFTSVMFDGSGLPISENIDKTAAIVEKAARAGVSVEGEVGFVGYANGMKSTGTNPDEAAQFDRQSGADALAISVGNVHLKTEMTSKVDLALLREIESVTSLPLVLHGGSGIPAEVRTMLAAESRVCKFNIGTELRLAFGNALRQSLADQPDKFDRIALLEPTVAPVREAAKSVITAFGKAMA